MIILIFKLITDLLLIGKIKRIKKKKRRKTAQKRNPSNRETINSISFRLADEISILIISLVHDKSLYHW